MKKSTWFNTLSLVIFGILVISFFIAAGFTNNFTIVNDPQGLLDAVVDIFAFRKLEAGAVYITLTILTYVYLVVWLVLIVVYIVRAQVKKRKGIAKTVVFSIVHMILFTVLMVAAVAIINSDIANLGNKFTDVDLLVYYISGYLPETSKLNVGQVVIALVVIALIVAFIVLPFMAFWKELGLLEIPEEEKDDTEYELLTENELREIIREELLEYFGQPREEQPAPQVIVVEKPVAEPVKEEVVEEEVIVAPVVEEPVVEVVEEVIVEEPVVEAPKAPTPARFSFTERITMVEEDQLDIYNELRNYLESYGLKSRISSTGDTYRLHKVTYAKVVFAGKKVKLYMKLNPADYVDTTVPFEVSNKDVYAEIPFVFKVKSGLSLRRAKELIDDMMAKAEPALEKIAEPKDIDYARDLKAQELAK